jgi:hypothetical protein
MKAYWGSGGIDSRILDLGTRWRWVVSFTPQGKSPWYLLDRRLGGSQSRSGRSGEEKNSEPLPGLEPPIIQPVAQCYTTELSNAEVKNMWIFQSLSPSLSRGGVCAQVHWTLTRYETSSLGLIWCQYGSQAASHIACRICRGRGHVEMWIRRSHSKGPTNYEAPLCVIFPILLLLLHFALLQIRGPFAKFVDRRQFAVVMKREAVTVMPSCSGGGNIVVAWSSSLKPSLEYELQSF